MDRLIAGYKRFRAQGWLERREKFRLLAESGQRPKAMVVSCIDSRVDPAMIFDAGPGDLITVRNVANLVPPYEPDSAFHGTSAALEFGVRILEVEDLIVLGHGLCGGVQTLLDGASENALDFIRSWMSIAESARERACSYADANERQRQCEFEVIKISLANLLTFPWIAERVDDGRLTLHGAWFAVHSGELMLMNEDGEFSVIDEAMVA
jgi:carbonic anhydrase